ncbi:methylated-DNA--[protein]-cysteine S-methyltransferase [Streptomyces sp. NPDC047061]|uniref:methylated-DNA--[protein]-cysteine S-methyltransferase n=1 Tax=Streptomyces sp. NPDC047061 TaxID=3154605 RepID=UPI0033C56BE0
MSSTDGSGISALTAVTGGTVEHLAELRARLAARAEQAGMVDVAYRTIDTPVGALLLAATDQGLVRVAYAREGFDDVLGVLAARISPRVLHAPARLDETARQIEQYFAGTRHTFDVRLDHRLSSGFRETVQLLLPRIEYGHTLSYKQVAEMAGSPKAVRAVGTACATNPLPVVVPCHRVLRTDGGLGGYVGGLAAKTLLLDLEKEAA